MAGTDWLEFSLPCLSLLSIEVCATMPEFLFLKISSNILILVVFLFSVIFFISHKPCVYQMLTFCTQLQICGTLKFFVIFIQCVFVCDCVRERGRGKRERMQASPYCSREFRGQFMGVDSFSLCIRSRGLNSGYHAWQKVPYPFELSCQPPMQNILTQLSLCVCLPK